MAQPDYSHGFLDASFFSITCKLEVKTGSLVLICKFRCFVPSISRPDTAFGLEYRSLVFYFYLSAKSGRHWRLLKKLPPTTPCFLSSLHSKCLLLYCLRILLHHCFSLMFYFYLYRLLNLIYIFCYEPDSLIILYRFRFGVPDILLSLQSDLQWFSS